MTLSEDDGNSAPHRRGHRPAFAKKDKTKAETTPAATTATSSRDLRVERFASGGDGRRRR